MTQYIVIYGDPASGLEFYGPFDSAVDALDWATKNLGSPFWVVALNDPEVTP
jgi:hypothetical protein